jgi:hypothetical protein
VKPAIVSKMPPHNLCAFTLQGQPDGNVGFVVKIGDDDLTTGIFAMIAQLLTNGDADEPHERGRIHTKRNFVGVPGIHQQGHARARLCDGFVHLSRLPVSPAPLNVSMKQMVGYGTQYGLG